jgi:hypothetical protein
MPTWQQPTPPAPPPRVLTTAPPAAIAHTAPAMPTWQQPTPPAPPPRVLTTAPPVLSATPGAPAEDREEGAEELDEIMDDDIP